MEYKTHEDNIDDVESLVVQVAKDLIQGKIDLLEGCRQLVRLHYKLKNSEEFFLPLIGIVSETDDFPVGQERSAWLPEALLEMDKEKDRYLAQVQGTILDACREIISRFSQAK